MKKIGLIFCVFFFSLYAGIDERIEDLEHEMHDVASPTPKETFGAHFVSARPEVMGDRWFFTFDILYWHMKAGGTEYAYTKHQNSNPSLALPIVGRVKTNQFDWEWGLRAGLGHHFPHDSWDLYACYTYYAANSSSGVSQAVPSEVVPLRVIATQSAEKAKSSFDADYQNVNLTLMRSFFISRFLVLCPSVGAEAAWIDLDQKVSYIFSSSSSHAGLAFKSKDQSHFRGVGPLVCLRSDWKLFSGISFFGEGQTSLLYGPFKISRREFYPGGVFLADNGDIAKITERFSQFVPAVNFRLGLCYDTYVNQDRQHIHLSLGYETLYYWRVNQMLRVDDTLTQGTTNRLQLTSYAEDVSFYGLTGSFCIDY